MNITFGKWQGWDTDKLAVTLVGRLYLSWGKENLKNSKWAKEFRRVLKENSGYDLPLSIKAEIQDNPDVSPDDIEIYLRDAIEQAKEEDAQDVAYNDLTARFQKYLLKNGLSKQGVAYLTNIRNIWSMDDLLQAEKHGRIKFQSLQHKQIVVKGLAHYWGEMEKI